jgi:hypothetical protein
VPCTCARASSSSPSSSVAGKSTDAEAALSTSQASLALARPPGIATISVDATSAAVAARFRDYRLEAWRAETPQDGWRLQPGQGAPFASAPASVDGTTVSGTITFNRRPGLDWAEVVLTAVAPDGRRYLLYGSGPQPTQFYGSVASWFEALTR